jgi:uncharacterized protein (DUF305 family)
LLAWTGPADLEENDRMASVRCLCASVVVVAITACSSGMRPSTAPMTRAASDSAAIVKARADSARYPYTPADIHFMSGMISHHAQAIAMARWAESHGASNSVKILAARIINAQQDEIGLMQQWLRDRRQPVPAPSPSGMRMVMNGVEHEMLMPGMLNATQLQQLDGARGADFDRLFLTFMIQHHQGAVSMVKELFGTYGAGQDLTVFKFASDVNTDQSTEIARMQRMLVALALEKRSP